MRIFLCNLFCSGVEKRGEKKILQNKVDSVLRKNSVKRYFGELKNEIYMFKINSET